MGTNPAVPLTFALAAYKEPETLAWLDEPAFAPPTVLFPTDVPPWWRTKKKSSHFYNGMSRGDHRGTMILASMVCADRTLERRPHLRKPLVKRGARGPARVSQDALTAAPNEGRQVPEQFYA